LRPLFAEPATRHLAGQLSRSATAVAANYRAVCLAKSRADFISKMSTVLEEADEAVYWLGLMRDTNAPRPPSTTLLDEANQLVRIFAASLSTAKRRK